MGGVFIIFVATENPKISSEGCLASVYHKLSLFISSFAKNFDLRDLYIRICGAFLSPVGSVLP